MITVELTNSSGRMSSLPSSISQEITYYCSFKVQGAEHNIRYKKGYWDGRKKLFDKRNNTFPMGLWHRIKNILDDNGIGYDIDDKRTGVRSDIGVSLSPDVEDREYQNEAVDNAIDANRSVLQVATGGGKTVIASKLITRLNCNTLFLVHTKDLLYQTKASFKSMIISPDDIGQIGDGVIDIKPITVATIQTMSKLLNVDYEKYQYDDASDKEKSINVDGSIRQKVKDMIDNIDLVIWDEVHRIACSTAYGVSGAIENAPYRIGLSASPWRDDGADLMIEASMGHTSYTMSASDLIDQGYLVQPIIKRVAVRASIPWHVDTRSYDQIYKYEIVENKYRNNLIYEHARSFMDLGMPTLILVQQIKHGKTIKSMISDNYDPIDFLSGRDLTHTRNMTIQEMRDGERLSLIASTIADEGLDIKRLAGLIMAGGGKSSTRALQRIGRVLRTFEGKTHALVVDFADEAKYLRDHAQKRKEIFETEPKFQILEL